MRALVQLFKGSWSWVLALGALAAIHGPSLVAHIRRAFDPYVLNDDARQQIYPFFRYVDGSLFPDDYIGDYYLDCLPVGFRALYGLSAPMIDPAISSKAIPYVTLGATVAGLGFAAHRLAGKAAAWGAMALVLGAGLYIDRMGGGLPRAFGFPILAWTLAALSAGRTTWLAVLVWLGACFYPVAGVVAGLATTLLLLVLPAADRGDAAGWSLRRRLRFLTLVAGVSVLLLLPTIVTSSEYAPAISADDIAAYPEAGPGGRYGAESRAPYQTFFADAAAVVRPGFVGAGEPWMPPAYRWFVQEPLPFVVVVAAFTVLGWLGLLVTSRASRRVLLMGVAAFVGHELARLVAPYLYLPPRYAQYPVPLLMVLMVTTAAAGFFALEEKLRSANPNSGRGDLTRTVATVGVIAFLLVAVGGRGSTRAGLNVEVRRPSLYEAVADLPPDAVVAGWPQGTIENVPYSSRRTALLTFETHQVFHQPYADEMRARMRALIDATFATNQDPVVRLREELGVTHMLLYLPDLRTRRLSYFKPFDGWIREARRKSAGQELVLERLARTSAVYRDGAHALVDLADLSGP